MTNLGQTYPELDWSRGDLCSYHPVTISSLVPYSQSRHSSSIVSYLPKQLSQTIRNLQPRKSWDGGDQCRSFLTNWNPSLRDGSAFSCLNSEVGWAMLFFIIPHAWFINVITSRTDRKQVISSVLVLGCTSLVERPTGVSPTRPAPWWGRHVQCGSSKWSCESAPWERDQMSLSPLHCLSLSAIGSAWL